jgi:hypothetical protein
MAHNPRPNPQVSDVDAFNDEHFPLFRRSIGARLECTLAPGEVSK